jgi:hypothetical protein
LQTERHDATPEQLVVIPLCRTLPHLGAPMSVFGRLPAQYSNLLT